MVRAKRWAEMGNAEVLMTVIKHTNEKSHGENVSRGAKSVLRFLN